MKHHLTTKLPNRIDRSVGGAGGAVGADSIVYDVGAVNEIVACLSHVHQTLEFTKYGVSLGTISGFSGGTYLNQVVMSADGSTCAVVNWSSGLVRVYDVATRTLLFSLTDTNVASTHTISMSYDGSRIAIGYPKATVNGSANAGFVDILTRTGQLLARLYAPTVRAADYFGRSNSISYDGLTIAIGADYNLEGASRGRVYVLNTQTGATLSTVSGSVNSAHFGNGRITLSADGTRYCTRNTTSSAVAVYQAQTGSWLFDLPVSNEAVMSRDGTTFATLATSGGIRVRVLKNRGTTEFLLGTGMNGAVPTVSTGAYCRVSHDGSSLYQAKSSTDGVWNYGTIYQY